MSRSGFDTTVAASVNNFRRWDQHIPSSAVRLLTPPMRGLERAVQRTGRGWWGPNQFVIATRRVPQPAALVEAPHGIDGYVAQLARRMRCPSCAGVAPLGDGRGYVRHLRNALRASRPLLELRPLSTHRRRHARRRARSAG